MAASAFTIPFGDRMEAILFLADHANGLAALRAPTYKPIRAYVLLPAHITALLQRHSYEKLIP